MDIISSQLAQDIQLPSQNGCKSDQIVIQLRQMPNKIRNDPGIQNTGVLRTCRAHLNELIKRKVK